MKLRSTQGGFVEVGEERGKQLLKTRGYTLIDEKAPEVVADAPKLPTPSPETPKRATAAQVRSWAQDNYEGDVPAKGRIPADVNEAYSKAHENQE